MPEPTVRALSGISRLITQTGLAWLGVSALVITLDRVTKLWVNTQLNYQQPFTILPFFDLVLSYNRGAAFSFLDRASGWQNWMFSGLAIVVSIIIINWLRKLSADKNAWLSCALSLILGGALGNVWDRWVYGYVIDFLSVHWHEWHFAIFNLADSAICVGTFMLLWHWIYAPQ